MVLKITSSSHFAAKGKIHFSLWLDKKPSLDGDSHIVLVLPCAAGVTGVPLCPAIGEGSQELFAWIGLALILMLLISTSRVAMITGLSYCTQLVLF
jgi:hypothetical protein